MAGDLKHLEEERNVLALRVLDLIREREQCGPEAERLAYDAAEAEGYNPEYCRDQKEAVVARRRGIKDELIQIRRREIEIAAEMRRLKATRIEAAPGKGIKQKRHQQSQEQHGRVLACWERIAEVLERIERQLSRPAKRRKVKV